MNTFWEITKRQLDEAKAVVRNKERELEDREERHQVEIKVSKPVASLVPRRSLTGTNKRLGMGLVCIAIPQNM